MAVATFTHSDARIKFYTDLCVQRHLVPKNHLLMSPNDMTTEINEMKKFYPANDAQLGGIKKRIAQLQQMGVTVADIPDEKLFKLTGGQNGTASQYINFLSKQIKENSDKAPASEEQVATLSEMFLCVTVDFESWGLSRKINLEGGLWRRCTSEEFTAQIREKITHKYASHIIDKYRAIFYNWKRNRASEEQKKLIRNLENRLIETKKPEVVELAFDLDGNIIELDDAKPSRRDTSNPIGYEKIDEDLLGLFSKDTAAAHINRLFADIKRKEKNVIPDDTHLEELRILDTVEAVMKKEYADLSDIAFKLEAIAGYEDPELHESIVSLLVEDREEGNDYLRPRKDKIRDFMLDCLDNKAIDFGGIIAMCEKNPIALEIILHQY